MAYTLKALNDAARQIGYRVTSFDREYRLAPREELQRDPQVREAQAVYTNDSDDCMGTIANLRKNDPEVREFMGWCPDRTITREYEREVSNYGGF